MPLSDSRKRANKKWDSENLVTFTAKIRKEKGERFRAAAAAAGVKPGEVLRKAIDQFIQENSEE